ncbi:hypothetical protein MTQ22_06150, partial [Corynebacterium bovis]
MQDDADTTDPTGPAGPTAPAATTDPAAAAAAGAAAAGSGPDRPGTAGSDPDAGGGRDDGSGPVAALPVAGTGGGPVLPRRSVLVAGAGVAGLA